MGIADSQIIDEFGSERRSEAESRIPMGGKFIDIRYFPLFEEDTYREVFEVSQV